MPNSTIDYEPLLNPRPEPPPWAMRAIDFLTWTLPIMAAGLSVWAGVAALRKIDDWAAVLGIAGGVASALGVLFTGWASRIRDNRLAEAKAIGQLNMDTADHLMARQPSSF